MTSVRFKIKHFITRFGLFLSELHKDLENIDEINFDKFNVGNKNNYHIMEKFRNIIDPLIHDVMSNPSLQKIDVSEELEVFITLAKFLYEHIDDSLLCKQAIEWTFQRLRTRLLSDEWRPNRTLFDSETSMRNKNTLCLYTDIFIQD